MDVLKTSIEINLNLSDFPYFPTPNNSHSQPLSANLTKYLSCYPIESITDNYLIYLSTCQSNYIYIWIHLFLPSICFVAFFAVGKVRWRIPGVGGEAPVNCLDRHLSPGIDWRHSFTEIRMPEFAYQQTLGSHARWHKPNKKEQQTIYYGTHEATVAFLLSFSEKCAIYYVTGTGNIRMIIGDTRNTMLVCRVRK